LLKSALKLLIMAGLLNYVAGSFEVHYHLGFISRHAYTSASSALVHFRTLVTLRRVRVRVGLELRLGLELGLGLGWG